jgi:DNA-binding transcriptional LysR family regulator
MDRSLEMQVFVEVVDIGTFIGAADSLRMSKATVSRHVDTLEQRLGVRLLHRTTRRLSLTQEGRTFHQRAKEILAAMDEAEAEISQKTGQPGGIVRVNMPMSFGILHLAPLWGPFMAQYPQIELDLVLNDRMVDLVDEGYDVAIRISALADSSLVSRKLASTQMLVCASPAYIERHGAPSHPRDLANHAVVAYSNLAARDEWGFAGPDGTASVRTRARVYSSNGDTCRAIALANEGVIYLPSFIVGEDIRAGRLVHLMPEFTATELGIYAVYPTRKQLPQKVRCLVDFLVEAFKNPRW